MTHPLIQKRALVCGGSQGIGRACAAELAARGAAVTVVARNEDALRSVVEQLDAGAGQAHRYIVADFAEPDGLRSSVRADVDAHGATQILVNNTGGPAAGPLIDAEPDQLTAAFSQHLVCGQILVQALLDGMKSTGYGRIVNIISTSVIAPIRGLGVSNTIRGAAANWGRTLAGELAPFGITVNNVLPGYTATGRLRSILQGKADKAGISYDEVAKQVLGTVPMNRLGDPGEIAAVVGFLSSPAASYLTGVNLPVDGGRTAVL